MRSFMRAGVEEPILVDWPELIARDEFLQALERRNNFVVAVFRCGARRCRIAGHEPISRWVPAIDAGHPNAVPHLLSACVSVAVAVCIDDRVLPVQIV